MVMPINPITALRKYLQKRRELKFFQRASSEEVFTRIYLDNKWGNSETRSGKGSTLIRTELLRDQLPDLITKFKIESLLDIPCGDFHWMKEIKLPVSHYLGADIVSSLIEENTRRYGNKSRTFLKLNLLKDPLPAADAILCRECLVHLSLADIALAVDNLKSSKATYLLTTHFPQVQQNSEIVTGKHRPLNLCKPPFNWPAPIAEIIEYETGRARGIKCLSLWEIATLP